MPALIVGLGNPGPKYEGTRHNLGADLVRLLAAKPHILGVDAFAPLAVKAKATAFAAARPGLGKVVLAIPETYMNLSGEAVGPIMRYHNLGPEDVLVVHDELDLPLGRMKFKLGGGVAGHNGLKSVAAHLGARDFARLRLGVGRPHTTDGGGGGGGDVSAWVLGRFAPAEKEAVSQVLQAAAEGVGLYLDKGLSAAQDAVNGFSLANGAGMD